MKVARVEGETECILESFDQVEVEPGYEVEAGELPCHRRQPNPCGDHRHRGSPSEGEAGVSVE